MSRKRSPSQSNDAVRANAASVREEIGEIAAEIAKIPLDEIRAIIREELERVLKKDRLVI
jgi:hypothetical protein